MGPMGTVYSVWFLWLFFMAEGGDATPGYLCSVLLATLFPWTPQFSKYFHMASTTEPCVNLYRASIKPEA